MNPFAKFDIDHLSARSLNLYMEDAAFWSLTYLHGYKDEVGAAAWRGTAVEAGLDLWLYKRDFPQASQAALHRFEEEAQGELDEAVDSERQIITPMLERACEALQAYPEPIARQLKIEWWFDGIEVPIIGYTDYEFEGEGIDLKATKRMPSEPWPAHARQVSLYSHARQKPYHLLYVTGKKYDLKKIDDTATHMKRLEWVAHSIRRVLSVFPDKHDASRIFVPNFEHPYLWKNEGSIELAKEIWDA